MKKPNFFIVGAPKCGTTSLYFYLKQHPDIFMPEDKKEPHFFCTDFAAGHWHIRDLQTYLNLFASAHNEKMLGEASTFYLYSQNASREIKKFCPNAKIIIMLRNPVDMLYSYHNYMCWRGQENIFDFEQALAAESARKQGKQQPNSVIQNLAIECLYYRELVKYSQQVQRYQDLFGKENVLIIIFDEFIKQTANIYREVLIFLDVNATFVPEFKVINIGKKRSVKNKNLRKVVRNSFTVWLLKSWMNYFGQDRLPKLLKIWDKINNKYERIPSINPELKMKLQQELAPEVKQISQLLGKDLNYWSK
ncbi:MAG: sulfotransferase [Oscillatoria sp. PMC 1068.18]|nr:sulfotransferase [Oscillatoria sp. PMC 1076.18]MEC4989699.1 sulfotransferase [Oscillatoria sp. PMC 1068.18]